MRQTGDPLRALAEAAVEGDDVALAELVRQTQPAVQRLCSVLGSGDDADDLAQETYLRAMGSLQTYRGDAPVLPWLLSIARRVCADQVRRRQRHRNLVTRLQAQCAADAEMLGSATYDDLLDALDPGRREAFVLTQLAGLSYAEAAEVVGCPVGTIRSRVARARADLQHLLRRADAS